MVTAVKVPYRTEVPVEYTWDLTKVYADDAAWQESAASLEARLPEIAAVQGSIAQGANALLKALKLKDEAGVLLSAIYVYAQLRRDADTTDPAGQALVERAGSLVAKVTAALAFIEPEILAVPEATIKAWQHAEPGLHIYEHALAELARIRPHVRNAEVENVIAQFSDVTRAPGDIFDVLNDGDLTFPSIEDETGQTVSLSHARYRRFMESKDRRVRRDAFKAYYSNYRGIRNTLGTTLTAVVRSHTVNARLRHYKSSLEASLTPNDIPLEVYHNLVETIDANLPRIHRYMSIRKRILGLDELRVYDVYAPLVDEVDLVFPYTEACQTIREALEVFGPHYQGLLDEAFNSRWIDIYENAGKRSGAYSSGSYSTPPYILLNYQDRLNDVFTLAHELGHSMHSYHTMHTQPPVYGGYTTFLAEVASTCNEALLTDYMLKTSRDPALRKQLIVQQLEDIRTTICRQVMFATFELDMHERSDAGEPLTAEALTQRYFELVARYHGPEVVLDDEIALEWSRVPHFYYNFYVFQYATGLSAALALSQQIIDEGQPAVDRYLRFLSSGSSRSSVELLREAGVDMATPAPVQAAMDTFDHLLDELEALSD